jgi:hypothetical protein
LSQNYFRETLSVPLLAPLLFYPPPPASTQQSQQLYSEQMEAFAFQQWYPPPPPLDEMDDGTDQANKVIELDEQKVVNASLVLKVAGLIVDGQGEGRKLNQNALLSCGFTKCLFELALASTAPLSLKSQALNVLTALLLSNRSNQDLLTSLLVSPLLNLKPSGADDATEQGRTEPNYTRLPPRPAIMELIGLAVNGPSQGTASIASLAVRASALGCFEAFVNDNMDARLGVIKTMAPPSTEGSSEEGDSIGTGKLLLEGVSQFPSTSSSGTGGNRFDPYKYLLSCLLFAHLIRGSETAKDLARGLYFGGDGKVIGQADTSSADKPQANGDDDDDEKSTLIQVLVGNFTMALREHGEAMRRERGAGSMSKAQLHGSQGSPADWTRVQLGYLIVLSTWFWESKPSVEEFLKESSNLQVLIQPVSQGGNLIDPIVSGMCAVVLGIAYEFGPLGEKGIEDEGIVTRAAMHPILHSRIGPDQFAAKMNRLRDDSRFKNTEPDVLENLAGTLPTSTNTRNREASGSMVGHLPLSAELVAADDQGGLWFDWAFVDFVKGNHVMIQKSMLVDPQSTSSSLANQSTELLDAKRQFEQMKENHAKSTREVDQLSKRLKEIEEAAKEEKENMLLRLEEATTQSEALREQLKSVAEQGGANERSAVVETEALQDRVKQLLAIQAENEAAFQEVRASQLALSEENEMLKKQAQEAQSNGSAVNATPEVAVKVKSDEEEGEKTKEELEKELEDLLILLDELSTKRKADKKKMRERGIEVSEDEGDDDDDADEDEDDVD